LNKAPLKHDAGFTLTELVVVIAIIGILSVIGIGSALRSRSTALARAGGSAMELKQFLTYSRVAALGSQNGVVVFFGNGFYGGCMDGSNGNPIDQLCLPAEQAALRAPMPEQETIEGNVYNVVRLSNNVIFGTFPGETGAHVAKNRLDGNILQSADGTNYYVAGGTAIGTGLATNLPDRIFFGNSGTGQGGTIYLSYQKDADNTFHYAVQVTNTGRITLFKWGLVDGVYRWKAD